MVFNSYGYLLLFLPFVVTLYRGVARFGGRAHRLLVLIAASLAFYALADAATLALLLVSLVGNFLLARRIGASVTKQSWASCGVAANIAVLVWFKFGLSRFAILEPLWGHNANAVRQLLLPVGLSFYTFQQIAFLVDTARERIGRAEPLSYAASVLFFPTIVAGPITYYRDFAPQVDAGPDSARLADDLTIGLVQIAMGLFKKTVIADTFALWVDPLFARTAGGMTTGPCVSWAMVTGFLLEMYFDFSGYSDMAMGSARMLGIRLPLNFYSPLRVTNIVDWWRRWHMSLGRFVNEYVFQSLALPLTRWGMGRGLARTSLLVVTILLPTAVSMVVIGAWHGAKWTYLVFGLMHAGYMIIAECWAFVRGKRKLATQAWHGWLGNALTLLAVLFALAPFRATDMPTTLGIWRGMLGFSPDAPGSLAFVPGGGAIVAFEIAVGLAICWLLPCSTRLLDKFEPCLDWQRWRKVSAPTVLLEWRPNLRWGLACGALLFASIAFIGRGSGGFVYAGY
ncbi:MAG: hypothetical protein M3N34_10550 [Pseudomonadota bacterium]|nr:hypothetical protein [Pseudomonadota bacterium]